MWIDPQSVQDAQKQLSELSAWVDTAPCNNERNFEALRWHRVAKVAEESGEVVDAMIRATGQNPRKQHDVGNFDAVEEELLDVAIAALGAVEHLNDNRFNGVSINLLIEKIERVHARAAEPRASIHWGNDGI